MGKGGNNQEILDHSFKYFLTKKIMCISCLYLSLMVNFFSKTFYLLNFQKKKKFHCKVKPKLGEYRWVSGFGQGERFLVKK